MARPKGRYMDDISYDMSYAVNTAGNCNACAGPLAPGGDPAQVLCRAR